MKFSFLESRWKKLWAVALVALAGWWTVGEVRNLRDQGRVKKMTETMKTVCVGRFLIDVPTEAQVSFRGAFLSGWNISNNPHETEEEFTASLAAKETELATAKNERGGNSLESVLPIERDGMQGKIFIFNREWTNWLEYGERIDSTSVSINAYVRTHGTSLSFVSNVQDTKNAQELEKIISQIKPLQDGEIPVEPGFCFGRALIVDPLLASQNERVTMFLRLDQLPDFQIAFDTSAGLKPQETLLARDERARSQFAMKLHSFRRGPRNIAGIPGEEVLDRFTEANSTDGMNFDWESVGEQNDVYKPLLALELTSGHSVRPGGPPVHSSLSDGAALTLWDRISSSIRVRPTQVPPVKAAAAASPVGTIVLARQACPATGWWQCDDFDGAAQVSGGPRRYFEKGEVMPQAVLYSPLTSILRLIGRRPLFRSDTPTRWELIAPYDDRPSISGINV
jgi:hypothetical protein